MTSLNANQQAALVHLAVTTRPHGSSVWDAAGVAAHVARLVERGLSAQEVINRALGHAWDRNAKTPGVLATPVRMAGQVEASNPTPYPTTRADECRLHPGQPVDTCRACAADRLVQDGTPVPAVARRYDDPPSYDEATGEKLRHRPIRELVAEARAEIDTTTEETR
jgi:hypothetical protein